MEKTIYKTEDKEIELKLDLEKQTIWANKILKTILNIQKIRLKNTKTKYLKMIIKVRLEKVI